MPIHFLFPQDPLHPNNPEDFFLDQWTALTQAGFSASLFSEESLSLHKPLHNIPVGAQVVYRGWMLKAGEYKALMEAIQRAGATPFTSTLEYLSTHHLPNWYPLLLDDTPETRIYPTDCDLVAELKTLNWEEGYFLKDYVKSLKTSKGSMIQNPEEAPSVLAEMLEYRGEIEGGICVRRPELFLTETDCRYFVLRRVVYSARLDRSIPEIVRECAHRIPSPFFSVDTVLTQDGKLRVIEIGDGQVSDIVGWTADEFAEIWNQSQSGEV